MLSIQKFMFRRHTWIPAGILAVCFLLMPRTANAQAYFGFSFGAPSVYAPYYNPYYYGASPYYGASSWGVPHVEFWGRGPYRRAYNPYWRGGYRGYVYSGGYGYRGAFRGYSYQNYGSRNYGYRGYYNRGYSYGARFRGYGSRGGYGYRGGGGNRGYSRGNSRGGYRGGRGFRGGHR